MNLLAFNGMNALRNPNQIGFQNMGDVTTGGPQFNAPPMYNTAQMPNWGGHDAQQMAPPSSGGYMNQGGNGYWQQQMGMLGMNKPGQGQIGGNWGNYQPFGQGQWGGGQWGGRWDNSQSGQGYGNIGGGGTPTRYAQDSIAPAGYGAIGGGTDAGPQRAPTLPNSGSAY